MDAVELVYDYFEDRAHASALIRQRRPAGLGLAGILLGAASLYVAQSLAGRGMMPFGWPGFALSLLWQVVLTFVATALLHLILELGGARGDARALFVHMGLSELVWMAAAPLIMISQVAFSKPAWSLRIIFFALGLWSLSYKARGIRDEYGISGGRAWLTLGLPYLAGVLVVLLIAFLATLGLVLSALSSWGR
ncbi:MAG: hypothetical protein COV48_11705 [Elusimicrobia bacterium CG11_big_fil_rev_8_21_14_0_20_64_6]|nr:MAG: hypothetical protein COV48_11705 [Elusimicrobia bacterium CG11_big_fil_rev_8_21_14_0_20_64_6]